MIDVPEANSGKAAELVMMRKGMLQVMEAKATSSVDSAFLARADRPPGQILTATQGEAVMTHRFEEYAPYAGDLETRQGSSLVSLRQARPGPSKSTGSRTEAPSSSIRARTFTRDRSWANAPGTRTWSST